MLEVVENAVIIHCKFHSFMNKKVFYNAQSPPLFIPPFPPPPISLLPLVRDPQEVKHNTNHDFLAADS